MSSFIPLALTDTTTVVSQQLRPVSPVLSQFVGQQKTAQLGNSPSITALQNLASPYIGSTAASFLFRQQSAIPPRKYVSFALRTKDGKLAPKPEPNPYDLSDGYAFQMYINPSNLTITHPPKTINATRTLGGWKLQHWYPDLGSISGDGVIGNMLERFNTDLKDSTAWRSFAKLLGIYQLNGLKFVAAPQGQNRFNLQSAFFPIAELTFDQMTYSGYFESFNYTESEDTPHTIKYQFAFKFVNYIDSRDIAGMTKIAGMSLSTSL